MKAFVFALAVAVAIASPMPSFQDTEEYDLAFLAEQEATGTIPAMARLNPKTFESAAAAKRAAEEELNKLGEPVAATPSELKAAEKEAMKLVKEAAADPMHEGMDGLTLDMGTVPDAPAAAPANTAGALAAPKVEAEPIRVATEEPTPVEEPAAPAVDTQNEQFDKEQKSEEDVPLAHHTNKPPTMPKNAVQPVTEDLPSPAGHLVNEDGQPVFVGTRPSAPQFPQFGFGMPQMQQQRGPSLTSPDVDTDSMKMMNPMQALAAQMGKGFQAMPNMNNGDSTNQLQGILSQMGVPMPSQNAQPMQLPTLPMMPMMGSPDAHKQLKNMEQMPPMGMPPMGMGMPQMPGMGMPQMPGMDMQQMPGMGMPQMPGMGMGMPQMPGMGMGMPQMPGMGMGMPQMPGMGMGMPQMPGMGMGMPQMPGMGMPQMPGMPGMM